MENLRVSTVKSNVVSGKLREKGNQHYKKGEFYEAMIQYNASICHALPESKEMAVAYGNRSAIYVKSKLVVECIENVKLARANGHKAENLLNSREEVCMEIMRNDDQQTKCIIWDFFKLSYPANEKMPFAVNNLELRENEKYGRHVVTSTNLQSGDIIGIEEPFFNMISAPASCRYDRCCYCLKINKLNLIPCTRCAAGKNHKDSVDHHFILIHLLLVMFCSEECQKKETLHHNSRIPFCMPEHIRQDFSMVDESLKIAGSLNDLLGLIEEEPKTVFDFDFSDPDDPSRDKNLLIAVNSLFKGSSLPITWSDFEDQLLTIISPDQMPQTKDKKNLMIEFIKNQERIRDANAFQMIDYNYRDLPGVDFEAECSFKKIGSGIFPFTSLFNHSCYPNCFFVPVDNKMVLVVTRPIKAGEQIFLCYIGESFNLNYDERKKRVDDYNFVCDCIFCLEKLPLLDKLPRKSRRFIAPRYKVLSREAAIEKFKKNCKYIDKTPTDKPCYEVCTLIKHNCFLLSIIAGVICDGEKLKF